MFCALFGSAGVATADMPGLPSDEEVAVLEQCIEAARDGEGDIAECKGVLSMRCLDAVAPGKPNTLDEALCVQGEAFAWDMIDMKLGTAYLKWVEGRTDFSRADYLADLEARLIKDRESCSHFPIGAEMRLIECTRDRAVDRVGLTYERLDKSRD